MNSVDSDNLHIIVETNNPTRKVQDRLYIYMQCVFELCCWPVPSCMNSHVIPHYYYYCLLFPHALFCVRKMCSEWSLTLKTLSRFVADNVLKLILLFFRENKT